eukprot:CAMPEP_0185361910 /NCGR_PEP_ID=MMETSP1364-20130426/10644_1 /TAXON_ID=38817 /ORGANISM="Gephyrocapsa oceanica, Strain RCC1303" /LENGTH=110 /DNA_ID=CAMNT_0027962261 /DNA_START=84 /DNA_END=414 /DNA_ORIENTATION=-
MICHSSPRISNSRSIASNSFSTLDVAIMLQVDDQGVGWDSSIAFEAASSSPRSRRACRALRPPPTAYNPRRAWKRPCRRPTPAAAASSLGNPVREGKHAALRLRKRGRYA